jgi:hypothetical protein
MECITAPGNLESFCNMFINHNESAPPKASSVGEVSGMLIFSSSLLVVFMI